MCLPCTLNLKNAYLLSSDWGLGTRVGSNDLKLHFFSVLLRDAEADTSFLDAIKVIMVKSRLQLFGPFSTLERSSGHSLRGIRSFCISSSEDPWEGGGIGDLTSNFGRFVDDVGEIAEGSDSTSISFTEGLDTGIDSIDSTITEAGEDSGFTGCCSCKPETTPVVGGCELCKRSSGGGCPEDSAFLAWKASQRRWSRRCWLGVLVLFEEDGHL